MPSKESNLWTPQTRRAGSQHRFKWAFPNYCALLSRRRNQVLPKRLKKDWLTLTLRELFTLKTLQTQTMTQLSLDLSTEINTLHDKLCGLARTSLETAIEIGELLTRQKAALKHGEWIPWCRQNLSFDRTTAFRYMKIFSGRGMLQAATFGTTEAYRLLSQPAAESEDLDLLESEPEAEPIVPILETPEQKAAAWDLAEELAEEAGTPVTKKHIQQATEAVSRVATENENGAVTGSEQVKEEAKKHVHVAQNSGENEWYTPPNFIESARVVMGSIDTDPASCEVANRTVKAKRFFTKEDNGLRQTWSGNVWMNPPYAQPLMTNFAEAITCKFNEREFRQGIVLVNNATETQWFQRMAGSASAVCFPKTRVKFLDPEGKPGAPLQGQAIIYFGENAEAFVSEFSQYGATFA